MSPTAPVPPLDLAHALRIQARANHLANRRLQAALSGLPTPELHAPRTSFFPSIMGTLDHVLLVDVYYIAALKGEADMRAQAERLAPHEALAPYAAAQAASDRRLIDWCDRADAAALGAVVAMDRAERGVQRDRAAHVLAHLFMHQTHHRGQVHAMLSGTQAAPPQLDEFLMPSDAEFRAGDMAALGWRESDVYGDLV